MWKGVLHSLRIGGVSLALIRKWRVVYTNGKVVSLPGGCWLAALASSYQKRSCIPACVWIEYQKMAPLQKCCRGGQEALWSRWNYMIIVVLFNLGYSVILWRGSSGFYYDCCMNWDPMAVLEGPVKMVFLWSKRVRRPGCTAGELQSCSRGGKELNRAVYSVEFMLLDRKKKCCVPKSTS